MLTLEPYFGLVILPPKIVHLEVRHSLAMI